MGYKFHIMCCVFSAPEPLQPMRGSFNDMIQLSRVVNL